MTLPPSSDQLAWIDSVGFGSPEAARLSLDSLTLWAPSDDLLASICSEIGRAFTDDSLPIHSPDQTIHSLIRVIEASDDPATFAAGLVPQGPALAPQSQQARGTGPETVGLHRLIRTLDGGPAISQKLLHDPGAVRLILDDSVFRQPIDQFYRELSSSLAEVHSAPPIGLAGSAMVFAPDDSRGRA